MSILELSDTDRAQRIDKIEIYLTVARQQTRTLRSDPDSKTGHLPFLEHVLFSVRVAGILFDSYLDLLWPLHRKTSAFLSDSRNWGVGSLIKERMLSNDNVKEIFGPSWCKNDYHRLSQRLPATAMYYMSALGRPALGQMRDNTQEARRAHEKCTETHCVADNIDELIYEPLHLPVCEGCEEVGPDMSQIESALAEGFIPVVRLHEAPAENSWTLEVSRHQVAASAKDVVRYVAISHVWAHGMGNTKSNSLPLCRLRCLSLTARRALTPIRIFPDSEAPEKNRSAEPDVEDTQAESAKSTPFWVDTLCIPRTMKYRKLAISRLREVCQEAATVLAISADLAGILPNGLYSTGLSCERRSAAECAAWMLSTAWMRRLWTLSETLLAHRLRIQWRDGALDVGNLITGLVDRTARADPYWMVGGQLGRSLQDLILYRLTESKEDNLANLMTVWIGMHGRSCSHEGDEAICAAQLLNLDVDRILSADVTDRSRVLYSMLNKFPQQMLFSGNPKVSTSGYRWADQSLLQAQFVMNHETKILFGEITALGLRVQYPGYFLRVDLRERSHSSTRSSTASTRWKTAGYGSELQAHSPRPESRSTSSVSWASSCAPATSRNPAAAPPTVCSSV